MNKELLKEKLLGAKKSVIMWASVVGGTFLAFGQDIAIYAQTNLPALSPYVDASTLKYISIASFVVIGLARAFKKNGPLEDKVVAKGGTDQTQ